MNWKIDFSKESLRFLDQNHLEEGFAIDKVSLAIRKFRGEKINVDIRKIQGEWEGFYRIRDGKLRILVKFQFESLRAYIDKIDWRGNAYK